jgi:hypothetical protein
MEELSRLGGGLLATQIAQFFFTPSIYSRVFFISAHVYLYRQVSVA